MIWASSCFKLFVHFGPSNDALSIGRSCWFWHRDGARCRLESLLMVMTHRCLNPIVLGRVGWWVKAWFSSWWFSATALSWGELWYTVDSQNNSMYLVRAWVFLQQSHGPGLLAVSLKLVSFWTTWAIGAWFNQMSPGSRTVGSRIQRLHWGGLWCFPSGKVEGDETEAWNEPQDPIRSAT